MNRTDFKGTQNPCLISLRHRLISPFSSPAPSAWPCEGAVPTSRDPSIHLPSFQIPRNSSVRLTPIANPGQTQAPHEHSTSPKKAKPRVSFTLPRKPKLLSYDSRCPAQSQLPNFAPHLLEGQTSFPESAPDARRGFIHARGSTK